MRSINILILASFICLISCNQNQTDRRENNEVEHEFTNQLIDQSSPYLLQHAHNPVNWYPWRKDALDKAKAENKLIIVSIGYAACHWCHVMEEESFEDLEVANYMNDHFVSIKIDREERPDIDQIYMNAVQLLTGKGGWPLNCITLPDGRPFYCGTYFSKAQWMDVLSQIVNYAKTNPSKLEEQAKLLTDGIKNSEIVVKNITNANFNESDLDSIFNKWKPNIDFKLGGSNKAPKFPLPNVYQFMMVYHELSKNADAWQAVEVTLDKMAKGGIYDQIGGGFARYSTDTNWKVPHFEKMLYDNAQLVSLYCNAFQKTKNPSYKNVIDQTLAFIHRELTSPEGGFYSSLDADSEGEEGKYYIWKATEMQNILGDDAELMMTYYNVKSTGNWEHGKNILFRSDSDTISVANNLLTDSAIQSKIAINNKLLLKERMKRIHPRLDDKILTSWNALMLKAYVDAYRVLDNKEYLKRALKSADFILTKLKTNDNRLNRNYKNGKSAINGFLDDYAFSIQAFIALYQATFDEKWLKESLLLTEYVNEHFFDNNSGMYYYTSALDDELITRKMEILDNVISSSNSEMAKNLYILGQYFYKDDYISRSQTMLNNVKNDASKDVTYYANWNILMSWFIRKPYEIAIVGDDCQKKRKEFDQHYLPFVILSGGKTEGNLSLLENKLIAGSTTIYVCQDKACRMPVTEVMDALSQIKK